GDRAAAETTASHTATVYPTGQADRPGDFDHGIQLDAAHLVIIAQGFMTGTHELADGGPVGRAHTLGAGQGALGLPDHMARAAVREVVQPAPAGLQVLHASVPEGSHS